MPTQEPPINLGRILPQAIEVDSFIRAFALRVLCTAPNESLWDITNRVCDRYFDTEASPHTSFV